MGRRKKYDIAELIGKKFGKLTIVKEAEKHDRNRIVVCKCECDNIKIAYLYNLFIEKTISCGCFRRNRSKKKDFLKKKEIELCLSCKKDESFCNSCSITYRNKKIKEVI